MDRDGVTSPVVGIYDPEPDSYLPLLEAAVPAECLRVCRDPERLEEVVADVEVLLAFKFAGRVFPRESVLRLPKVAWVQLASAGSDHMLPFNPERLTVTNASGIHGATMAEYVIGMLIHGMWDFRRLERQRTERRWLRYEVPSLSGLTMAIVGGGQVGQRIAERARAFGMKTHGVRRGGAPSKAFDETRGPDGLQDVLETADVVVLALPLTPETRGMFGERVLGWIKPGAWLVNVSRGGIVVEEALLPRLQDGRLGGGILDVFATEPLPAESAFWDLPNVMVTPHIASEFMGWPRAVAQLFLENLERFRRGATLHNVVDPALGY